MTNPARQSKALAELDALQIALNDLRFEYARGNVYCDTPEYKAFLEAVYAVTEIDAVQEVADTIRWADEDLYGNPIGSRAAREAGRAFDEVGAI